MDLEELERQAAAAEIEAGQDILTDADRREIAARAKMTQAMEKKSARRREKIALDLARREDAAREEFGPKIPVRTLVDEGSDENSFVLRYSGSKAFAAWESGIGMAHAGLKDPKTRAAVELGEVNKTFALSLVHEWGYVDQKTGAYTFSRVEPGTDAYARLALLLDEFGGIASAICYQGRMLSGAAKEARKS